MASTGFNIYFGLRLSQSGVAFMLVRGHGNTAIELKCPLPPGASLHSRQALVQRAAFPQCLSEDCTALLDLVTQC